MPSPIINVMTDAAYKAAKGLLRDFGEVSELQISKKGPADFVTKSDKRAEDTIIRELSKARPGYRFLAEESGETDGDKKEFRWIIDPLDGTHNFIHAIPYFCISIALEKTFPNGDTSIIAGLIYDPIHDDIYTAEKGDGARLNGNRKLAVSNRDRFENAMVVVSPPHSKRDTSIDVQALQTSISGVHASIRYMGASALELAHMAAGRFDAVCLMSQKPWDIAAGKLLIEEAGGQISDTSGGDHSLGHGDMLATNGHLHPNMLKLLAQASRN